MKLYYGYIFNKGIRVINALGINEWALNEGRADKFTEYYVEGEEDLEIAVRHGLNEKDALIWYINEKFSEINLVRMDVEELRSLAYSFR
jgi:hypothetical protein